MNPRRSLFQPPSLGIAVLGTGLAAAALLGIAIASIAARFATFGVGIGIVLLIYGALVGLGAWLGYARVGIARGLMVAPALLHLAVCWSLATAGDMAQTIGAIAVGMVVVVTLVAALWPATRHALSAGDQLPEPEGP